MALPAEWLAIVLTGRDVEGNIHSLISEIILTVVWREWVKAQKPLKKAACF